MLKILYLYYNFILNVYNCFQTQGVLESNVVEKLFK